MIGWIEDSTYSTIHTCIHWFRCLPYALRCLSDCLLAAHTRLRERIYYKRVWNFYWLDFIQHSFSPGVYRVVLVGVIEICRTHMGYLRCKNIIILGFWVFKKTQLIHLMSCSLVSHHVKFHTWSSFVIWNFRSAGSMRKHKMYSSLVVDSCNAIVNSFPVNMHDARWRKPLHISIIYIAIYRNTFGMF